MRSPFVLQAVLLVTAGSTLAALVVWLTKRRAISFRFTIAWSLVALLAILAIPIIPVVEPLAGAFSLSASAFLTVVVALIFVLVTIQLSISVSHLGYRLDDLAIAQALQASRDGPRSERESDTLVVVPAWNEQCTIGEVVLQIRTHGFTVIVVDDGSTDRTAEFAAREGAHVLRLPTNLGVGAALRTGLRYAVERGYRRVVQCDGDGQHPPVEIRALLAAQEATGAHMLIGSRFLRPGPSESTPTAPRLLAMSLLARSASSATGVELTDATSGFRVIGAPLLGEVARVLPNHYLGDTYEMVVAAGRAGYRIVEFPVPKLDRRFGSSSATALAATKFTLRVVAVVALRAHAALPSPADKAPPGA